MGLGWGEGVIWNCPHEVLKSKMNVPKPDVLGFNPGMKCTIHIFDKIIIILKISNVFRVIKKKD